MKNNELNVVGFTDTFTKLKHYTYNIVNQKLENEKLINEYYIDQNIDFFASSFFYYNNILSTISLSDLCTLQLFQFDKEIKITDLDTIYDCDDSTFINVGDSYENSSTNDGNIVLDFVINENGVGIKDLVTYKINTNDLTFKKITTKNFVQKFGHPNDTISYYNNDKHYFAITHSLIKTSIYELNDDGSVTLIQNDIGFKGIKAIKSFLLLDN